jgi:hypothetical protein
MTFDYYNEAIAFCEASKMLNPSKPFKKGVLWHVSFLKPDAEKAEYEKLPHWEKPFKGYDEWRNVEGLMKVDPYVSQAVINLH